MLFGEVAHEKLFDLQAAGIPPTPANEKGVGARASGEAGRFRIEEQPFLRIFERGACAPGERSIASSRKKFQRRRGGLRKCRRGEPVANCQVLAVAIFAYAGAENLSESVRHTR